MKALTTMLVERATAKLEPSTDGLRVHRDAAQEQLAGEQVVDACLLSRPSSYAAGQLASTSVPGDEVVALERTMTPRGGALGTAGGELARWRRSELDVHWKPGGYLFHVAIDTPGREGTVECCVGKSDLSASFLELLRDPAASLPAVG